MWSCTQWHLIALSYCAKTKNQSRMTNFIEILWNFKPQAFLSWKQQQLCHNHFIDGIKFKATNILSSKFIVSASLLIIKHAKMWTTFFQFGIDLCRKLLQSDCLIPHYLLRLKWSDLAKCEKNRYWSTVPFNLPPEGSA